MKHLSIEHLGGLMVDEKAPPAPFPGKFPTWFAWRVKLPSGKAINYLGKPNGCRFQELQNLIARTVLHWQFWEFDRRSLIYVWDKTSLVNPRLWQAYHPWHGIGRNWLATPFYVKKLGGFRVYSPYQTLKKEYIASYKKRAADNKVDAVKVKAVPVPTAAAAPTPSLEQTFYAWHEAGGAVSQNDRIWGRIEPATAGIDLRPPTRPTIFRLVRDANRARQPGEVVHRREDGLFELIQAVPAEARTISRPRVRERRYSDVESARAGQRLFGGWIRRDGNTYILSDEGESGDAEELI